MTPAISQALAAAGPDASLQGAGPPDSSAAPPALFASVLDNQVARKALA